MFIWTNLKLLTQYGLWAACGCIAYSLIKTLLLLHPEQVDLAFSLVALAFLLSGYLLSGKAGTDNSCKQENLNSPESLPLHCILSKRELDVLHMLMQHKSNKEIASVMCIELSTLKSHINHIYKKTGVNSRKELLIFLTGKNYPPAGHP